MDWNKWLRDMLCQIYKKWGGNCENLGTEPGDWVNSVSEEYEAQGAPTFPSTVEKEKFVEVLDDLEEGLKSPDNSLTVDQNAQINNMIAALRTDLS